MSFVFEVPKEYGYVLAVATSTIFVNTYHKLLASTTRKASGIKYPTPYATKEQAEADPKAFKFNLAQRAHSNFGENLTPFLIALLVAGLRYPGPAAYTGAAWVAGRLAYGYGYVSYGPSGRLPGYVVSQLGKMALTVLAIMTSYNMIQGA